MIEHHLDIETRDGAMNTFITHPEEGGPFPVIVFLMDAPGKREELHDMARRLGTTGYYVVLPNLYYRSEREFDFVTRPNGETRDAMFALMSSLTVDLVARDAESIFAYADVDPNADAARVGCVGYCMSGPFSFALAGVFPDRVMAAASVYGVRLFGDDSPAHLAERVKGELYFACAATDDYAPTEMIEGLEGHLRAVRANARVEWYPGTHHGFAFPLRPAYDKPSAERHWERLHALFERNLR
jgi:carboxymethylenebutenolidase